MLAHPKPVPNFADQALNSVQYSILQTWFAYLLSLLLLLHLINIFQKYFDIWNCISFSIYSKVRVSICAQFHRSQTMEMVFSNALVVSLHIIVFFSWGKVLVPVYSEKYGWNHDALFGWLLPPVLIYAKENVGNTAVNAFSQFSGGKVFSIEESIRQNGCRGSTVPLRCECRIHPGLAYSSFYCWF